MSGDRLSARDAAIIKAQGKEFSERDAPLEIRSDCIKLKRRIDELLQIHSPNPYYNISYNEILAASHDFPYPKITKSHICDIIGAINNAIVDKRIAAQRRANSPRPPWVQ